MTSWNKTLGRSGQAERPRREISHALEETWSLRGTGVEAGQETIRIAMSKDMERYEKSQLLLRTNAVLLVQHVSSCPPRASRHYRMPLAMLLPDCEVLAPLTCVISCASVEHNVVSA